MTTYFLNSNNRNSKLAKEAKDWAKANGYQLLYFQEISGPLESPSGAWPGAN